MARINIDRLALEVMRELEIYRNNTVESVEKAVKETAKETVQELRVTSPVGPTGEYAKSWTYRRDPNLRGRWKYSMVVCSKKPDYRLTHLLEYGHAKATGGRVAARPHIKDAELHAIKRLERKLRKNIEEG